MSCLFDESLHSPVAHTGLAWVPTFLEVGNRGVILKGGVISNRALICEKLSDFAITGFFAGIGFGLFSIFAFTENGKHVMYTQSGQYNDWRHARL